MSELSQRVVDVLGRGRRHARFFAELERLIGDGAELEHALAELESGGRVIIREQYCADPHLVGTDLRIVALVPEVTEDADGVGTAMADIEAIWQRWLGEYLANHRCG